MPFAATWMDLQIIILREVRQKDKYHMISLICGILKTDINELTYKTNRLTDIENKLMVSQNERWEDG